jgi:SH3-like domain-containing protein
LFAPTVSALEVRTVAKLSWAHIIGLIVGIAAGAATSPPVAAADQVASAGGPTVTGGASGLALPRFVSLKSDRVKLRAGASVDYPTTWVLQRIGLPLEIIAELDAWRQVRMADGVTGWVQQSMVSGRRTALVLPWDVKPDKPLPEVAVRDTAAETGAAVAKVEAGVIVNVRTCEKRWCQITVGDFKGYIEQKKLWGVYDGEIVK